MTDKAEDGAANQAAGGAAEGGLRPFDWGRFFISVTAGVAAVFVVALALDHVLIAYGVELSRWRDAAWSAAFTYLFAGPGVLAVWRLGVVTLRQYILTALILFAPLTVLSLIALAAFEDVVIAAPWVAGGEISAHDLAYTAYLRIARSAVLMPCYLAAFYFAYHRWFGCAPRTQ